jgi:C4-dicarboxylate-binding protein DctP
MHRPALSQRRHCLRLLAACTYAGTPLYSHARARMTIRLSHVVAQETPKGLALQRFAELVAHRSEGSIQVQIFPDSQLYGDNDEVQALQFGAVDMLAPSVSKFGRIGFDEFEVFSLPFVFDHLRDAHRVTQGELGQQLLERLSQQRLVGLGFLDNGFKHMSANRPVLSPIDLRGLRMRIQASWVIAEQMRVLGARPIALPFDETRTALSARVVDGTENTTSNFWTQRMDAVQSDLSLTQHGYLGYAVIANERFWRNIPASERALIHQALVDALQWGNAIADSQNEAALVALRAAKTSRIHTLSAAQRTRFREAVWPVYAALAKRIGASWVDAVKAL